MQKKIPPYNWIVANGLTHSSIDFVCACYEYSKTHPKWSHLDVQAHIIKRVPDTGESAPKSRSKNRKGGVTRPMDGVVEG